VRAGKLGSGIEARAGPPRSWKLWCFGPLSSRAGTGIGRGHLPLLHNLFVAARQKLPARAFGLDWGAELPNATF